jgi:hypothetical protein
MMNMVAMTIALAEGHGHDYSEKIVLTNLLVSFCQTSRLSSPRRRGPIVTRNDA